MNVGQRRVDGREERTRTNENGDVGLGSASDHVGNETFVSGSVKNDEMFLFGVESGSSHLDGLALVSLLFVGVQRPRQVPGLARLLARFVLILLQGSFVHLTC